MSAGPIGSATDSSPSSDPKSLSSCMTSLEAPDMNSSSESILGLADVVSGVGGLLVGTVEEMEAEAIFLLDRVSLETLGVIASAFRFLDRGGMMLALRSREGSKACECLPTMTRPCR